MKFLIAAIIGAFLTWLWLTTAGKKHITEIITVTETNWVTKTHTETQYQDVARWVTHTNIIQVTNTVEKIVEKQVKPVPIIYRATPQKSINPPAQTRNNQPTVQPQKRRFQGSVLRGARPAGKVVRGSGDGKINTKPTRHKKIGE